MPTIYRLLDASGNPDTSALSGGTAGGWNKINLWGVYGVTVGGFIAGGSVFNTTLGGYLPSDESAAYDSGEILSFVCDFGTGTNNKIEYGCYDSGVGGPICRYSIDGAAWVTVTGTGAGFGFTILSSTVTAGTHHVRIINQSQYFNSIRLTAGTGTTENIVSTAKRIMPCLTPIAGFIPATTTVVANRGALKPYAGGTSFLTNGGNYGGGVIEFSVANCSALELLNATYSGIDIISVAVNGTYDNTVTNNVYTNVPKAPYGNGNEFFYAPLFAGFASGTYYVSLRDPSGTSGVGFTYFCAFRAHNGTSLAAVASTASTAITVAAGTGTKFAANDWIEIGFNNRRSIRQVTAISTDTLTLNAAPKYPHEAGTSVINMRETTAASFAANSFTPTKTVCVIGDSTTAATVGSYPPANVLPGDYPALQQYDSHVSWARIMTNLLGWQEINLAHQGDTTGQMYTNCITNGNIAAFAPSADYYVVWGGVNDINGGGASPTTLATSLTTLVNGIKGVVPGKPIYVMTLVTTGTITGGYTLAQYNAAIKGVCATTGATCIDIAPYIDATIGGVDCRPDGLHYTLSGETKAAAIVANAIQSTVKVGGGSAGSGSGGGSNVFYAGGVL